MESTDSDPNPCIQHNNTQYLREKVGVGVWLGGLEREYSDERNGDAGN